MVNEGIITLLLFIRLMNWEYDSDPGQRQHIINLGTESDTHECYPCKGKNVIRWVPNLSSRKVFERVQNHVFDLSESRVGFEDAILAKSLTSILDQNCELELF